MQGVWQKDSTAGPLTTGEVEITFEGKGDGETDLRLVCLLLLYHSLISNSWLEGEHYHDRGFECSIASEAKDYVVDVTNHEISSIGALCIINIAGLQ